MYNDKMLRRIGIIQMRAAAKFDGKLSPLLVGGIGRKVFDACADGNDANGVGIALAEDSTHARDRLPFVQGHFTVVDLQMFCDLFVDYCFHSFDLLDCHRMSVGKVETQFDPKRRGSPFDRCPRRGFRAGRN